MLFLQGLFKNLQTSDTNGHFSEYVALRMTFSVSTKTVPLLLAADGTPTLFPGSLLSLGTRLNVFSEAEGIGRDLAVAYTPKCSRKASDHIQQSHDQNEQTNEFLQRVSFCWVVIFLPKFCWKKHQGLDIQYLNQLATWHLWHWLFQTRYCYSAKINNKIGVRERKKAYFTHSKEQVFPI